MRQALFADSLVPWPVAADIKYGSLLEIDETLKKMRAGGPKTGDAMLVEEVGPEEIAGVVSKWTGTGPSTLSTPCLS
jgi:ATP-dependent Clp protease ATP-binding subunit ClpB